MPDLLTRRRVMAGAIMLPALAIAGCATTGPGYSPEFAVRRLLVLSAQRALAVLVPRPGTIAQGLTHIPLPGDLAGGAAVGATFLRMPLVRDQVERAINRAAGEAAERAVPYMLDSIRAIGIRQAGAVIAGGPTAATDYLRAEIGIGLFDLLLPAVGDTLRLAGTGALGELTRQATGIDFAALHRYVAEATARAIYRAIGREEAAIRADPRSTGDPAIVAVFGAVSGGRR